MVLIVQFRVGFVLVDSFVLIFFYIFGLICADYVIKRDLINMKIEEYRALKMEYMLLMIILVGRCLLNGFFYFLSSFY